MYIEEGKDIQGRVIFWILDGADLVHSAPTRQEAQNWINNQNSN
jgi:hypothetical protein